jgi:ABC-type transport system substrate-binding protein
MRRLPITLELIALSMSFALLIAIPAGVIAALRPYSWHDYGAMTTALVDINQRSVSFFRNVKSNYGGLNSPEIEELTMKWRHKVDDAKRQEIAYDIQRAFAKDMLWCNITGSPYFQAYGDNIHGYHFMNQVYVRWETTWIDKA